MSKHTPGPWKYTKCPCGHKSCSQFFISNQGSAGFEEDDARLICAAPDLLEALKSIMDTVESHARLTPAENSPVAKARAAIAKAEGL